MSLYGNGRAVLLNDPETAAKLAWPRRRRSLPEPEVILVRRRGDPRREPWITAPGWRRSRGPSALWGEGPASRDWSYLAEPPGVLRYLERLALPPTGRVRLAIVGLGRVGGTAAATLASLPSSRTGIAELLVGDADQANLQRWVAELSSIVAWSRRPSLPLVRAAGPDEMMRSCDAVIVAATAGVPPLGTDGDVRNVQFAPNRRLLHDYLAAAARAEFAGLLLVVSDPVECLALAAFLDSNRDDDGRFTGGGLAPERIGGLALTVMWGRALARARAEGWCEVERRGGAYGPHSADVVVFDDLRTPRRDRSAALTVAAREGNLEIRRLGFLPYVGPAISSVALALPPLLAGRVALASVFLDGIYFGAPARLRFALHEVSRNLGPAVRSSLVKVHARLAATATELGLEASKAAPTPSTGS